MSRIISLHSDEASLVLEHDEAGQIVWRHCGARLEPGAPPALADTRGPATFSLDEDRPLALAPATGLGWFGPALVTAHRLDGSKISFAPEGCSAALVDGKLAVECRDAASRLSYRLTIEALAGGAFRFAGTIRNTGHEPVSLGQFASAMVPLPPHTTQIISYRGRHNAELAECNEMAPEHRWERISRRGISGHGGPPGAYVLTRDAGRHTGLVFALQLAWSGDNLLAIERDDEGYYLFSAEALFQPGEIVLAPGEEFAAPAAILAISNAGQNGAMRQHHSAVRSMVSWPDSIMRPRPVHLNSWEACYFDQDAQRIIELAQAGADIGAERFVLDDGWFKGRHDDTAGLGDWAPDRDKYPDGLVPLARAIVEMGLEFGLWIEPEMINPESDLYRAHPEFALGGLDRNRPTARNQLVIDMRRTDVRVYLFECFDRILSDTPISYLKWDHNRDHAPSGGAAQTSGTYSLMNRIRGAHPTVEIEGCAGGGGRSDAGMAAYANRFWTSDNIDAVSRINMQRGFLAFLPPEMMGSHVGASPAHATGRSQAIGFRAAIACMGHFGIELDPRGMTGDDRTELKTWIAFYKQWRHLLHGHSVHLGEGADGIQWQAHGHADNWLLFVIRSAPAQNRRPQPLALPFLDQRRTWTTRLLRVGESRDQNGGHSLHQPPIITVMKNKGVEISGSWLAHNGVPLPIQRAESVAIYHFEATI